MVYCCFVESYTVGIESTQTGGRSGDEGDVWASAARVSQEEGLTIEQLAERVGLSTNYLGDVERGKKLPSMATLIRIVNVLDISADELLKDDVNRADYLVDAEISARMANLTQRQRVAVLRMLDSILKEIPNLTDRT